MLAAGCCVAGLKRFCDHDLLMSSMATSQIHLFLFWKLPGKAYNASRHLRVSGLVSGLIFQNLGHLIKGGKQILQF